MDHSDTITLTGLRVFGRHGVYADERRDGQDFIVDLTMHVDTRRAAETDDVRDTVHYGEIAEQIAELVGGEAVNLLEVLAARIADRVLEHSFVDGVVVTVHKPHAPIPLPFSDVSVTIHRDKSKHGEEER